MTAWMEPFALWLADVYLAATILLLATAAILALVKQPALRMAVAWGVVPGLLLVACCCLSSSRPHLGLWPAPRVENKPAEIPIAVSPAPAASIVTESDAARDEERERLPSDRFEPPPITEQAAAPIVSSPEVPAVSEPDRRIWSARLLASLVGTFLAGSLFVTTWLVLGVWRASRLVRESEPAPQACLDELRAITGTPSRPPRLRVNRRLLTPVATGAVRPAILLPEEPSREGEPHALRAVLAHEWTHIKNGDLWLLALDRIVLSLLWAHPLYWWTRRRFRADQEFLADAAAAAQIGAADYAALLVHWARKVTEQRSLTALTAVGIWERPAGLTERVTTLLADSHHEVVRTSGRTRVGVAAALAVLSLAAATISLRPPQKELAQAAMARVEGKSDTDRGSTVARTAPALPIVQSPPVSESLRSEPTQSTAVSNDVQGTCRDKQGKPLAGVQVYLYAIQKLSGREQLLRQGTTDAEGRFRFPDCLGKKAVQLSWQLHDEDGAAFEVFARRVDLGTGVKTVQSRGQQLDFTLTKARSLTGTVRDRQGRPVAGAIVREMYQPLPKTGWLSAKSDAKGNFTIADLSEYEYAGPKGPGPALGLLSVAHPGYSTGKASYNRVPGHVEVVLGKPATIEGIVVYGDTGKPAAGVEVFANRIEEPNPAVTIDLPSAKTDKHGRYTLRPLPEGLFNLSVSTEPITGILSFAKGNHTWVAAPIETFRTEEGKTAAAPPIRLVKGGLLKGNLYQYRDGAPGVHEPVKLEEGEKLEIIVFYGPSVPAVPGFVADMTFVRPDGTFELRLPPGMHYLSLPNSQKADGTYRLPYSDMGEPCTEEDAAPPQLNNLHRIKIREGQTTEIELSVFRPLPQQQNVDGKKTENAKTASPQLAAADDSKEPKIIDYHVAKDEIGGMCLGRGEARLSGVDVSLYFETVLPRGVRRHDLLGRTATNEQGQFVFKHVRHLDSGEARGSERYVIVARRKGLATEVSELDHAHDWVDLKMGNAVAVRGTVKDEQGKPVVGALVRCNDNAWRSLTDGVHSARTDALGQFQIDDVATLWGCVIEHPDYPAKVLYGESTFHPWEGNHFPSDVIKLPLSVTLVKGSVVEGQVIDSVTRRPGAGVTVTMQAMQNQPPYIGHRIFFAQDPCLFSAETQTDDNGHYRFTRLPAGRFAVYLTRDVPARTSIALHSLDVPAATAVHAPDIRLVKGGIVHGRLIDDLSGQPARLDKDEKVRITVDGPARPRQREIQVYLLPQSFPVAEDGTFQLRLPPGKNLVRVSGRPYLAEQPADRNANQDIREIEIKEGQEATLEFRVVRLLPMKRQSSGVTSDASSSVNAGGAKPEWFHVRGGDIGGIWSDAAGHGIAGAKVTLLSTDADGSNRKVLKATTTNSWGQFLFVCAPCLSGPNKNYELVLSRDNESPDVRKAVHPGEWLELKASPIQFRGIRQMPMKPAPEKPAKKSPASTSGAVQRPVQAPPIRHVKPGVVKGRLIDALTGQPALVGDDECVTIGVHDPSTPQSGAAIEGFQVKTDGTFELRLPPGKKFVYVSGGPFLVRKPGDPYANPDVTQVDVKEGTETTIEVRVIRQVPMKETPEKTINKPPAPTSGAVKRPSPIVLAEAPTVSPKIVDYHLEKEAVAGLCLGRDEVRIAGVEVSLYIIGRNDDSHRYIGRTMTNEEGQFVFQHVPQLRHRQEVYLGNDEEYLMVARKKGLATVVGTLPQRHDWLDLRMRPGVSMNGVVQDEQGHPVTGALVRGWSPPTYGVPEEAQSVRTNARGEFQIDDLEHFGAASVSHPHYMNAGFGNATENPVVATLRKGSIVEGQVIDGDTGQPVADVLVTMGGLGHSAEAWAPPGGAGKRRRPQVTTDFNGRYQFRSLGPKAFNLSFRGGPAAVASATIDAMTVGSNQILEVPPVRLAKGAIVSVRLIDNDKSQVVSMEAEQTVVIGIRSGEASASADTKPRLERLHMRHDGTIGVWLPAGKHAISLNGGPFFSLGDVQQGIGHDLRQVDIKGGEDATVLFRVVRITPSQSGGISRVQRGAF